MAILQFFLYGYIHVGKYRKICNSNNNDNYNVIATQQGQHIFCNNTTCVMLNARLHP